jgi:undecaprenyl-diphosphatase
MFRGLRRTGEANMNPFDRYISSFINAFAQRSLKFDQFVVFLSDSDLLKGVLVFAVIWWLWFQDKDVRRKRESLLAAMIASFPALAIAWTLSRVIVRPRPLNEAQFLFRAPYGQNVIGWVNASSFPSDHAVLFFALVTGIFLASRRMGWFTFVYVTIMICLPRLYIGAHYATDILAGGAIGMSMAWLANRPTIRIPLTGCALQWLDARPAQFYCFSFLATYLMAELFDPLFKMLKMAKLLIR